VPGWGGVAPPGARECPCGCSWPVTSFRFLVLDGSARRAPPGRSGSAGWSAAPPLVSWHPRAGRLACLPWQEGWGAPCSTTPHPRGVALVAVTRPDPACPAGRGRVFPLWEPVGERCAPPRMPRDPIHSVRWERAGASRAPPARPPSAEGVRCYHTPAGDLGRATGRGCPFHLHVRDHLTGHE